MLVGLRREVEDLEILPHGDELQEAFELLSRLTAKLSSALGEFDRAKGWDLDAATSATAWLRARCGLAGRDAARWVRTARCLEVAPATRAAWQEGTYSDGQVRAIVANVSPRTAQAFSEAEAGLVDALAPLGVGDVAQVMQQWASAAEDAARFEDPTPDPEPEARVHLSQTLDGRWVLDGDLDAESGSVVATGLRLAQWADDDDGPTRTPAQRRAEAMAEVFRFFLDHQRQKLGGRHRPHLNIVVNLDDLLGERGGQVLGGPSLDGATIRRLLCDAGVHRVVTSGRSTVLDYGLTTRTIPAPLYNALVIRDQGCRFEGCDRPPCWCDGHHVVHVIDGGPTCPENTVLLCRRHHRRCHQPGWKVKLAPDGELHVTDPDGRVRITRPPPR